MNFNDKCPICGMGIANHQLLSPIAPTPLWIDTSLKVNGVIVMEFGYGDGEEHIYYCPKYCPECGRKVKLD